MSEKPKKRGPAPKAKTVALTLKIEPAVYDALAAWCARQRVPPTEQDAIRTAIREFLEKEQAWPITMKTKNPG
jgi:hypothetical protein